MKNVHQKNANCEIFSPFNPFSISAVIGYDGGVFAKSKTSRRKLNNKPKANISTPFNRAFFVRSVRTPQENNRHKIVGIAFSSMVERKGQCESVGCFPLVAVSYPFTLYRHAVGSEAESLNQPKETATMLYRFLTTGEKRLKITIYANSKAEALSRVQFTHKPLLVARLGTAESAKKSPNQTACNTEQNHRLQNGGGYGYDECTTSNNGRRTRKTCGFFVSQISPNGQVSHFTKFAVRLISRNKASIRTNKASRLFAVVETVSPLSAIFPFHSHTKQTIMNKQPPNTAQTGVKTAYPTLSSRFEGVIYA